jgi:dipicolinate synthase subunit A
MSFNRFGVIGGDLRQIEMMKSIALDGNEVSAVGFDDIVLPNFIDKVNLDEVISKSDYIILPLPVSNGHNINMPFSDKKIPLDDGFAKLLSDKIVFCGSKNKLITSSQIWKKDKIYDYSSEEEFLIRNAVPTAEGAIEIAIHEYPGTINGSKCLVAGFGKIGKVLSKMLSGLGANVTASARKSRDIAWIESQSYKSVLTSKLCNNLDYNIIFSTIPSMIFDKEKLCKIRRDTLIIDLASDPGSVDFTFARTFGIKTIHALALPGKVAPKAAGEIIKTTVYNTIKNM